MASEKPPYVYVTDFDSDNKDYPHAIENKYQTEKLRNRKSTEDINQHVEDIRLSGENLCDDQDEFSGCPHTNCDHCKVAAISKPIFMTSLTFNKFNSGVIQICQDKKKSSSCHRLREQQSDDFLFDDFQFRVTKPHDDLPHTHRIYHKNCYECDYEAQTSVSVTDRYCHFPAFERASLHNLVKRWHDV